jgi:selenocysteine lyase/cysteine desulfurase
MSYKTPLHSQRPLFSIPSDVHYLNSAYMGLIADPVRAAGQRALRQRSQPWNITQSDFFDPAETVRGKCARLVNGDAESIALIPTAAFGIATVARNLALRPGQNIVLLGEQFPSNVYSWRNFRSRGVNLRTVDAHHSIDWTDRVLEAIDADTGLVAIEQAHWTDGTLFDLDAIGRRARSVDACFVIDATQTAAAMPIDVVTSQLDAVIVHSYKSMLCNYGLGFAWLGQRFADGAPLEEGWLMRQGSEEFSRLIHYQDDYAAGMRRYDTSLRANPMLIQMLDASLDLLLQWQAPRIREYCLSICRSFVDRARNAGFAIADENKRAANVFGLRLPAGLDPGRLRDELSRQRIFVTACLQRRVRSGRVGRCIGRLLPQSAQPDRPASR